MINTYSTWCCKFCCNKIGIVMVVFSLINLCYTNIGQCFINTFLNSKTDIINTYSASDSGSLCIGCVPICGNCLWQHKIFPTCLCIIPCCTIYLPNSVQLLSCNMLHACVCCEDPLSLSGIYFDVKNHRHSLLLQYLFPWGSETLSKNLAKRTGSKLNTDTHTHRTQSTHAGSIKIF